MKTYPTPTDTLNRRDENLDELIFENRNKDYGAYWLRNRYKRFVLTSFLLALALVMAVVAYPMINAYRIIDHGRKTDVTTITAVVDKIETQVEAPKPPEIPEPKIAQIHFSVPQVVDSVDLNVQTADIFDLQAATVNIAPPANLVVVTDKHSESAIDPVDDNNPGLVFVQEPATFEGGDLNNFRNWVSNNIVYPADAVDAGINGKVTVQFAVNSKGKVVDVKILRSLHPSVDKEVVNCLLKSPTWIPAKQGGNKVKQLFTIPVNFSLK
jgi:periplasmic protein TonB